MPAAPQVSGAFGAHFRGRLRRPVVLNNFRRVMMNPNMCSVLKLDNGKVVSIANEQNHRQTESQSHPVSYYYLYIYIYIWLYSIAYSQRNIDNKLIWFNKHQIQIFVSVVIPLSVHMKMVASFLEIAKFHGCILPRKQQNFMVCMNIKIQNFINDFFNSYFLNKMSDIMSNRQNAE